jgi:peptidoglycan/xylan/chitin deacetylase (PgdA/CDA1 family)
MIRIHQIKKLLAEIFDTLYFNKIAHYSQVKLFSPFIRAIYYHDVPHSQVDQFEKQLHYFAKHFSNVGYEDLIKFHDNAWKPEKPGLIISFDDGLRSSYEIARPLLEKYNFTGWFFIPPALIDIPIEKQSQKATEHRIGHRESYYGDSRVFLTWDQIFELDKNHVIGCHTLSHTRLRSTLSEDQLYREIVMSKYILEEKLDHEVPLFAWVGGEEWSYSQQAADIIRKANYKVVFQTNKSIIRPYTDLYLLDRINIESNFSLKLMRFQLSGFMDMFFTLKRRRVHALVSLKSR